jgi:hypothetical protein
VLVEASAASTLEMPETQILLQFLVVPLDAPAQLRQFVLLTFLADE